MPTVPKNPPAASPHDALLATKLFIPRTHTGLVSRPRLQEQLNEAWNARLVLLSAPAGFGKTTLLSEWAASISNAENERGPVPLSRPRRPPVSSPSPPSVRIAWLSLDAADNDPVRFLRYLVAALKAAVPEFGESAVGLLGTPRSLPAEGVLTVLLNEMTALPMPILLVLDDYHLIENRAVNEALGYLVEHLPPHAHIVLSTRADPPLPLARWRSRGQLREVRADDLRFTPEEAALFLNQAMGLNLAAPEIAALEERTEGWIVGLQMAALSLRGRPDAAAFVQSFSGSHRYVLDYLMEEVLEHQPEEVLTFLLRTSILERLCGPLCDAVTGQPGGQALLEHLERRNLFLVPLDDERVWYRYHHLFRDLLGAQLQRSLSAEGVARLYIGASEWHGQNGSVLEAIQYASRAADDERVERLIEQNYMEMVNRGEMSWLRFWTGDLSREVICRRPRLCIYEAMSHAWFGELEEADRLLEEAEERIRSDIAAPGAQTLLGHAAYVSSRVAAMRGDIHRAIALCLEARELVPATNLALQLDISMTLGYEYFLNGDYGNAGRVLQETLRTGTAAGSIINTVAACCITARMYAVQGLLKQSYDFYQVGAQLIPESSGQHLGAKALLEIGIADVLCEWNDLDAARVHVKQGLALMPWWGKADDFVLAYVTLARIHLAQGNTGDAIEAAEKAIQFVQTRGVFSEARHTLEITQVRLWLAQGDVSAAQRWAASQEERVRSADPFRFENELTDITYARVLVALNTPHEAIQLLSGLEETARSARRMGRVIEILLLQALAMRELGDSDRAILALTECLTLAEPEGYVRVFLDEGAPVEELLRLGIQRRAWAEPRLAAYAQRLCADFQALPPGANLQPPTSTLPLPASGLIEPLSERELEVLALVAAGCSNQQIAEELILALGTVKAHIHNIYGKLGVKTRVQAIVRARELEIL